MLEENFGFAEHHKKASNGFSYKIKFTRNEVEAVLDKARESADARNKNDHIHWFVAHYTPSIQQQGILSEQILSKTPTELRKIERSVFLKQVNNQNLWNLKLGSQESINLPGWSIIAFQQRDRQNPQNLNIGTSCRLPVNSAQCVIGTKNFQMLASC